MRELKVDEIRGDGSFGTTTRMNNIQFNLSQFTEEIRQEIKIKSMFSGF